MLVRVGFFQFSFRFTCWLLKYGHAMWLGWGRYELVGVIAGGLVFCVPETNWYHVWFWWGFGNELVVCGRAGTVFLAPSHVFLLNENQVSVGQVGVLGQTGPDFKATKQALFGCFATRSSP